MMIIKKYSLVAGIVVAAAMLTSCGKEYTCVCTVSTSGRDHVIYNNLGQVSKNDADKQCANEQIRQSDSTNSVTADCHL